MFTHYEKKISKYGILLTKHENAGFLSQAKFTTFDQRSKDNRLSLSSQVKGKTRINKQFRSMQVAIPRTD